MKKKVPAGPSAPPAGGEEVQQVLYPYGVGIDTHSRFIQVCVLKVSPNGTDAKSVTRVEAEFKTDWQSLLEARKWVLSVLPEVTDPRRFEHPKQLAAYCGCDPSLKISAGKVTSYVRRQGNLRLHQALLYAAAGLLRQLDSPLGRWGKAIAGRHKSGGYRKACGAIARRLACMLWHVHRKAEAFSYADYHFSQQLIVPETPLEEFLPRRAVKRLTSEGIKTAARLAEAYVNGKLAGILGLGQQTLKIIHEWVLRHGRRLDGEAPPHKAADPAKVPSGKIYVLNPALTFKPKRTPKNQTDAAPRGQRPAVKDKQ
jgi:hypothetical protein